MIYTAEHVRRLEVLCGKVLGAIRASPGEFSIADLAEEIDEFEADVASEVYQLSRTGHIAPRAYRLYPHVLERLAAGETVEQIAGPAATEDHVAILRAAQSGPLSRDQLAERTGLTGGTLRRALVDLDRWGYLASSSRLWPGKP
jgi:DNA-binding IclR family transcriptional regulator